MQEGAWSIGATMSGTTVRVRHDAPSEDPPVEHDQRFWIGEVRVMAAYGLSEKLALDVQVPLRMVRTSVRYRTLDGSPLAPDFESIHHRNETLRGISDPRVGGRFGWGPVSALAGLSVPLGRVEENPFALGDAGLPHQHIQFGSGTVYPFAEVHASHAFGRIQTRAHVHASLPIFENEHGFLPGQRYGGSVEGGVSGFALRADLLREEAERWDGAVLQDGNLGRTDALVALVYRRGPFFVDLVVPIWTQVRGGQLEYPAIVTGGFSTTIPP